VCVAACTNAGAATTTTGSITTVPPPTTVAPSTTEAVTSTSKPPIPSPINGLPVADPEMLERRVMAVKVDNHTDARPQSGIDHADAVIELPVEGITRFITLFHATDSDYVGPVRSGRPSDGPLLNPLNATFAISGGQDWVLAGIRNEGVPIIGEERPAMFRVRNRFAPHNLYTDTNLLRQVADRRDNPDAPPEPLFAFGPLPRTADKVSQVVMDFGNGFVVTWTYDSVARKYQRFSNGQPATLVDIEGDESPLTADTLVVILARRYIAQAPPGATSVPAMDTVGTGDAHVFAGGKMVIGVWSRDSTDDLIVLTDEDGKPLTVPPGFLWVSIVPQQNGIEWQ
jgi:hypothetical protein